jgi:hypothetical protein
MIGTGQNMATATVSELIHRGPEFDHFQPGGGAHAVISEHAWQLPQQPQRIAFIGDGDRWRHPAIEQREPPRRAVTEVVLLQKSQHGGNVLGIHYDFIQHVDHLSPPEYAVACRQALKRLSDGAPIVMVSMFPLCERVRLSAGDPQREAAPG